MQKTLDQLFEIEEKANKILSRANEEKVKLLAEFEQNIILMEEAIASNHKKKLSTLQQQADVDLTKEISVLINNSEKQLKKLDETNANEHDAYVTQVFENVIHL